jgi:branched-chain amino acid transport system ATP-binding protein
VNRVDFDVAEHQVMGLIGPNGSGKSTTINLISGALPLGRRAPSACAAARFPPCPRGQINRRGIARTFPAGAPAAIDDVLENVVAGAVFGHRRRWGHEARPMPNPAGPGRAGGQGLPARGALTYIDTKRVELARVLASDPKAAAAGRMAGRAQPDRLADRDRLMRALRDEGRTIILVEHVMDAIRSRCATPAWSWLRAPRSPRAPRSRFLPTRM